VSGYGWCSLGIALDALLSRLAVDGGGEGSMFV
jgi:hypothetical protein